MKSETLKLKDLRWSDGYRYAKIADLEWYRQNQIHTKVAGPRMVQTEPDAPRPQDPER